jgi:hypothetical protein
MRLMDPKQAAFLRSWWAAWQAHLTRVDALERRLATVEGALQALAKDHGVFWALATDAEDERQARAAEESA